MSREPSTTIEMPSHCAPCPRQGRSAPTWTAMFREALEVHGKTQLGLVGVKGDRAWFQVTGDPTPYSMRLTADELAMFHLLP